MNLATPEVPRSVAAALAAAGVTTEVKSIDDLSGGCIHRVICLHLVDGSSFVAKVNRGAGIKCMFEGEMNGLHALERTNTVLMPRPLAIGQVADEAALLMTQLQPTVHRPDDQVWARFGGELAALHESDAGDRFGFHADNHIGSTKQVNTWCDDWVEFNARYRLGFQLDLAHEHGRLGRDEADLIDRVIANLDKAIPRRPHPSLLHGDLWSGNALSTRDESGKTRIAVIDPACSIGDGLADLAMMTLFGGFPSSCLDAYAMARRIDLRSPESSLRIAVYQLYHVLNHVNLFGRGYVKQAMELARQILTH